MRLRNFVGGSEPDTEPLPEDRETIELCGENRLESHYVNWSVDDGIVYAESPDGDVASAGVIICEDGVGVGLSLDEQSIDHLGILAVFEPDEAREIADAIYDIANHVEERGR